jgi:RNA polymerase sigma factor (sigma-70 family)
MADGEKQKQNQLLRAFLSCRDALVRSILKMRARQEDVDDILQETYLRVMNASEKRTLNSPQDYLFVVSRNLVIEKLSRQSREIAMEINDALVGVDDVPVDRALHYRRKFKLLNDALRALPEKQRRAILLRKYYGLSHQEVARKMNVSVSSVEKYISGGIKECKRSLQAKGYEEENSPGERRPHRDRDAPTRQDRE